MAQGKQAKIVTDKQESFILHHLTTTRYPLRDKVLFLLSIKAGLRAKEMAALTWAMVTDADGQVGETLHLVNAARKGETGGRSIPLHRDLRTTLVALAQAQEPRLELDRPVLRSERGGGLSAESVQGWFQRLYETLELARGAARTRDGARSSRGRRVTCRQWGARSATSSSSPGIAAWPPHNAISRATATPSASLSRCCSGEDVLVSRALCSAACATLDSRMPRWA